MYDPELLERLKLFNSKAAKLRGLRPTKYLLDGPSLKVRFPVEGPVEIETAVPEGEEMDAFVLTLRFFIQKRDRSAFPNVAEAYEKLPVSQEQREQFRSLRRRLNEMLESRSTFFFMEGQDRMTYWERIQMFVYGEYAHADPRWERALNEWKSSRFAWQMGLFDFMYILANIVAVILRVEQLNADVLNQLG